MPALSTIEEEDEEGAPVVGFSNARRLTDDFVHRLRTTLSEQEYKTFKNVLYGINSCSVNTYDGVHAMEKVLGDFPELRDEFNTYLPNEVVPGSDLYCYTAPGTRLYMRHGCSFANLTEKSDLEECPICLQPFDRNIRTLACGHSFCNPCLLEYLQARKIPFVQCQAITPCPTCRQVTTYTPEVSAPMEKAYNTLLENHLRLQSRARLYACPFEDCHQTFLKGELTVHVDACAYRRYMCDQGCKSILRREACHKDIGDCLRFIKGKLAAYEKESARTRAPRRINTDARQKLHCCAPS